MCPDLRSSALRRVVIVTGASRGIGAALAQMLDRDGFEVIGLARNQPDDWSGRFFSCDLASPADLDVVIAKISNLDEVWGLVNNAGTGSWGPIEQVSAETMHHVLQINSVAPALLARAAASRMTNGGGRIVNICSTIMTGKAERSVYAASKAALASLTRTWALELGPRGITVNAVSPGPIDTPPLRRRQPEGSEAEQRLISGIPVGRIGGPDQVANLVAFLMRAENYYLTGQVIAVDGGRSLRGS